MPDLKSILGAASAILLLFGYVPYIRSVAVGRTKPHAFSWLIWGLLAAIGFAAQVVKGAGAGSWMTGFEILMYFTVFALALIKGVRRFDSLDWYTLGLAFLAIALWTITNQPLFAAVLVTLGDAIGFVPTFRKGYAKPHEEHLGPYVFGTIASVCAVLAISEYSATTWLYPFSLILTNGAFTALLLFRRPRAAPVA